MAQTLRDLMCEFATFEYSADYWSMVKESHEIQFMERFIENQKFIASDLPVYLEAGISFSENYFGEEVVLTEGVLADADERQKIITEAEATLEAKKDSLWTKFTTAIKNFIGWLVRTASNLWNKFVGLFKTNETTEEDCEFIDVEDPDVVQEIIEEIPDTVDIDFEAPSDYVIPDSVGSKVEKDETTPKEADTPAPAEKPAEPAANKPTEAPKKAATPVKNKNIAKNLIAIARCEKKTWVLKGYSQNVAIPYEVFCNILQKHSAFILGQDNSEGSAKMILSALHTEKQKVMKNGFTTNIDPEEYKKVIENLKIFRDHISEQLAAGKKNAIAPKCMEALTELMHTFSATTKAYTDIINAVTVTKKAIHQIAMKNPKRRTALNTPSTKNA